MAKKTKTKRFSLQGFDNKHYRTTQQYANAVDALFDRATAEIAQVTSKGTYDPNKPFSFDDYPQAKSKVQSITASLASNITSVVERGSRKQWLFACQKNDDFVASIMDTSKLSKARLNKMQDRNLDALQTFQGRKVNGMELSKRVWQYVGQYKNQIELGIDVGIGDGRSAQSLARDLKKNLKDPDRLFRRVRDKHGNLQLSKAAKAFHPGQGVYRSSVKNAQRLTRSEINMAYREADWIRWQQLDFVVGFEVKISNRHEEWLRTVWSKSNKGKVEVCDQLKGRYPKTFKFKGWHPQCMCYCVPILMDEETFDDQELSDLKSALKGTEYKKLEAKNVVKDVPQGFKDWVDTNTEKQDNWGSTPYFVKDNFKRGQLSQGLKHETTSEPAKPVGDSFELEMQAFTSRIAAIKALCKEWNYMGDVFDNVLNTAYADRTTKYLESNLQAAERTFAALKDSLSDFTNKAHEAILKAKQKGVSKATLANALTELSANKSKWVNNENHYWKMVSDVESKIAKVGYSDNMPDEFVATGKYLHGENYTFDKQFFDLIDSNKSVGLSVSKQNKGAYYSPSEKKVYLFDASRNAASNWERKAVVYHEFGHAIDWQRDLRHQKELADMRANQIKQLKKQSTHTIWSKSYNYETHKYELNKIQKKMSKVAYIDRKLQELSSRIFRMKNETFEKRGITKYDVLEQIGSVRDTIKSLVISYGDGHSTAYFKRPGTSEAEYLAHAFENAFLGNAVFKKYLPEIYTEMIAYIRTLK